MPRGRPKNPKPRASEHTLGCSTDRSRRGRAVQQPIADDFVHRASLQRWANCGSKLHALGVSFDGELPTGAAKKSLQLKGSAHAVGWHPWDLNYGDAL
jgi:predicted alpha/beta-fold hydrolase